MDGLAKTGSGWCLQDQLQNQNNSLLFKLKLNLRFSSYIWVNESVSITRQPNIHKEGWKANFPLFGLMGAQASQRKQNSDASL